MLKFDRKPQNSVKQLFFNKKILKKAHSQDAYMCSVSPSVTSPYTRPHPGHSQGKIFADLAQGYAPTLFGRKVQYKVTVCILRFCSTPGDSRGKPFGSPLAYQGFPGGSAGKEFACNAGDLGLIPELGRSPREGKGNPLQYSCLENSMDCIVYGVAKSWTHLSDFHFHFISIWM